MRNVRIAVAILSLATYSGLASAYKENTHDKLSEVAASESVLTNDPSVLRNLGLTGSQKFKNSRNEDKTIVELIRDGARFEDNFPRSLNHFFDPLNDKGLGGVNTKSPDWALEDKGDIDGQAFSYKRARQYFYDALAKMDQTERDRNFGRTFQTLGQVIHHLQDMAQPQHVRDDDHCDIWPCRLIPGLHNLSRYEKYSDEQREKGKLPFDGYAPVNSKDDFSFLTTARAFWHTQNKNPVAGLGVAEFTNTNFLSAGTNFDTTIYPIPRLGDATPWNANANTLIEGEGLTVPPECLPPNNPCVITFYRSRVQDNYRSTASKDNDYTSTLSIFDQDLQVQNKRAFSLNRFNFNAAHEFLIPRAVAYSAGLIDYFFRGQLSAEDVVFTDTGITLKVKNAIDPQKTPAWANEVLYAKTSNGSAASLAVAFDYQDSAGKTQYGVSNTVPVRATDTLAPGQVSSDAYDFTLTVPSEAKDVNYRLVFRGKLGQEEDAVAVGEVEPVSGFLVTPNYVPADGIPGPRAIFKQGGAWRLSDKEGLQAGNIDWKGWYINGKPTKVITWQGPKARYFPDQSSDPFTPNIFQNGELFSVAPNPVLGAALTKDTDGKEWLIAICKHFGTDVVYRRPNMKSDSPVLHHPITAKDGWQEIGRFPPDLGWNLEIPWFFNGSGTEAQTMRRITKYIFDSSGRIIGSQYGGLDRAKIEIADGSAKRVNLKNFSEITVTEICDQQIPTNDPCTDFHVHIENTISKANGSYIIAVDYKNDAEQLAVLSDTRARFLTFDQVDVKNSSCSIARRIRNEFNTASGQLELKIGSRSLVLDRFNNESIRTSNVIPEGSPSIATYTAAFTQERTELDYTDLRFELASSKKTLKSATTNGSFEGRSKGDSTVSFPVTVATQDDVIQEVKSDIENQKIFTQSNSNMITDIVTLGGATIPSCGPDRNQTITYVPDYREILKTTNGSWSVDSGLNLFVSQEYRDQAGIHYFNYLTGGHPKEILPGAATNATYYPIKVIK